MDARPDWVFAVTRYVKRFKQKEIARKKRPLVVGC